MTQEEHRLVTAARAGSRTAFDALYQRHAGRVYAFARHLSGSQAEAEDLTQEAFVAAFQGLGRFRGQSTVLSWLLGIVVRRRRDGQRRPNYVPSLESPHPTLTEQTLTRLVLQDALACLPEPQREAFLLVASQGLTHREAAAVLQEPLGTVKWRVAEASRRLRVLLTDPEEQETADVYSTHA